MMPGIYPSMVNRMLMRKSALQPRSRNTPRGGRKMARMILRMSLPVKGILMYLWMGPKCSFDEMVEL